MGTDPNDDCADEGAQSCGDTGICDGAGACVLYAAGTVCAVPPCAGPDRESIASECDGAGSCQLMGSQRCQDGYACVGFACLTRCSGDADCLATHHCESNVCVRDLPLGAPCTESGRCQSNYCVDGVCCESACDSECEACEASKKGFGADGICEPVTADTDPDDECAAGTDACSADGLCDGAGACREFAKPTTPCGATTCTGGAASGSLCDGAGVCGTNTANCAPYDCNGNACGTTCTADADCASGAFCTSASTCAPKKENGASCEEGAECVTGLCVDAFCCEGVCGDQCVACDVEGSRGTCTGVTGAPHGSRPACADDGQGCAGFCDGQILDACVYPADDTACGTSSCDNGEATYFACNSAGACMAQAPELCSPFACETSGEACNTDCTSNADCATGFECDVEARDCVEPADGPQCSTTSPTTVVNLDGSEERCEPYLCVDGACLTQCTADTDCAEGWRCFGDVCDVSLDGGIVPEPPASDPAGCDCHIGGSGNSSTALWAALLAALAAARRRRERRSSSPPQ
jgi:MYXO-CTERM domain-containing protein